MLEKAQKIFTTTIDGSFEKTCRLLLEKVTEEGLIKLAFFGYTNTDSCYVINIQMLERIVKEHFGGQAPLVSYIAQESYPNAVTIEATYLTDSEATIERKNGYMLLHNVNCTELVTGGLFAGSFSKSTFEQATEIFATIGELLFKNGFVQSDIYRQWNYIPGITAVNDGSQNYQEFNDARSIFYATGKWDNGYPAATGIGTSAGGVMVELCAIKGKKVINKPIDNPMQIAAHNYSQQVLDGKVAKQLGEKTTPKFERARLLGECIYISGTAAIKGEASKACNDAVEQAAVTMEIMDRLVAAENIPATNSGSHYTLLRVYVKRECDMQDVQRYMQSHYPNVPKHYLIADICRPELLIEIEGTAHILY